MSDKLIDMASVHLKRNLTDDLDDAVIDGKLLDIDKERDLERESGLSLHFLRLNQQLKLYC